MSRRSIELLALAAVTVIGIATVMVGGVWSWGTVHTISTNTVSLHRMVHGKVTTLSTSTESIQPRPTSTPDTPGIVIATSNQLDLPDPFLLSIDHEYYMYMSTAFGDFTDINVPMMRGVPGRWGEVSDSLPEVPSWAVPASAGGLVWDPNVAHIGGTYLMYFAAQLSDVFPGTHCIGVAKSPSPGGPFDPAPGPPLVCQRSLGGDIDAQLFSDPDGPDGPDRPNYLVWKSDNNNLPGSGPTTIWAAPLADNGLSITGTAVAIFRPDESWEEPILEAPQMVKAPDGSDWLFFSAGTGFFSSRYAMGAVECLGPLGGCHDVFAGPLISSNAQGAGPGEETVFTAPDTRTWLLYSPWHTQEFVPFRPVEAARIGWARGGPYIGTAGRFPLTYVKVPGQILRE